MDRGAQAEQWAAQYLSHHGLQLVEQNYRSRYGEIDLIMRDGETLVFVEVRMRTHAGYGGAEGSIDARKQQRLIRTAQHYLAVLASTPPCRFDVVLMSDTQGGHVRWLRHAFDA